MSGGSSMSKFNEEEFWATEFPHTIEFESCIAEKHFKQLIKHL